MPYSMEFRIAVANDYEETGSSIETAEKFGCSESWVRRLIQRFRETGSLAPRPTCPPDTSKLDANDLEQLRLLIEQTPDMTLGELADALSKKVSVPTIWRATRKLKLPLKKKSLHASEQDRADVKLQREEWYAKFRDVKVDQLVFLDEFGATTNMTRRYARGPKGQRIVCKTPHGHWKLLSTIAAMTSDGMLCGATFDGATDTQTFVLFVEEFLAPHLKPGQVLVMDNLPAHKSPRVDELVEARGARVLRLPPYSPDYNPIEMAISKMKTLLRSLEERTVPGLYKAIGTAMASITEQDAINYVQHCRYGDTIR